MRLVVYENPELDWDNESKRLLNCAEHQIDFGSMRSFFDGSLFEDDTHPGDDGELRYKLFGFYREELTIVIFTWRGEFIRLISARKANPREEKQFDAAFARTFEGDE